MCVFKLFNTDDRSDCSTLMIARTDDDAVHQNVFQPLIQDQIHSLQCLYYSIALFVGPGHNIHSTSSIHCLCCHRKLRLPALFSQPHATCRAPLIRGWRLVGRRFVWNIYPSTALLSLSLSLILSIMVVARREAIVLSLSQPLYPPALRCCMCQRASDTISSSISSVINS